MTNSIQGYNKFVAQAMSEAELQENILAMAHATGWVVAHFRPALTRRGTWITPVQADGKGFPDLVMVKDRVIYVEIKSEKGQMAIEQRWWQEKLIRAGQLYFLLRPKDWLNGTIEGILKSKVLHPLEGSTDRVNGKIGRKG